MGEFNRITKENLDTHLIVAKLIGEIHMLGYLIRNRVGLPLKIESTLFVDKLDIEMAKTDKEFLDYYASSVYDEINLNFTEKYGPKPKKLIQQLLKVKRNMEKILKEKELNYSGLEYSIQTHEYKNYFLS